MLGKIDNELEAGLLAVIAHFRQHRNASIMKDVTEISERLKSGSFPLLVPIADLVRSEVSGKQKAAAIGSLDVLWNSGRLLDFLYWSPVVLQGVSDDATGPLRGRIVNIVQRVAGSLDDHKLKREFLEFPRIRDALLAVRT